MKYDLRKVSVEEIKKYKVQCVKDGFIPTIDELLEYIESDADFERNKFFEEKGLTISDIHGDEEGEFYFDEHERIHLPDNIQLIN